MANAYNYSNTATQTTLSGNISAGATSITVGATTGFPTNPFVLAVDYGAATEELVVVTAPPSGTTLTVTRGFSGTSAQSHSVGAVVRHVVNAQDLIDWRTHEAATADVHGVTGALVGATQAQTLTNKTLTGPTINGAALLGTLSGTPTFSGAVVLSGTPSISTGAALAGTFSGTPTFSGNLTFSGTPNFTSALATATPSTTATWRTRVTADTQDRFYVDAGGVHQWGPGNAVTDTNLYRATANTLKTDDSFTAVGALSSVPTDTSLNGLNVSLPSGTVGDLVNLQVNSSLVAAMDSSGQFRNYGGNAPTTYTPTVGNIGSATFATRTGYYWRLGKMIYFVAGLIVTNAGSGSGTLSITTPTNIDRSVRQIFHAVGEGVGINGHGYAVAFTGGATNVVDRIRSYDGQNLLGSDLFASGNLTIQGWYREA